MEAFQTMMRAFLDELTTNQKKENRKQIEELKEFNAKQMQKNSEETRAEFKEFKEQLTTKLEEINTRIAAVEQTIVIENKREQTFIISNDNSNTIINIKEENKIMFKKVYLIDKNIPIASYTHTHTH